MLLKHKKKTWTSLNQTTVSLAAHQGLNQPLTEEDREGYGVYLIRLISRGSHQSCVTASFNVENIQDNVSFFFLKKLII